MNQLDEFFEDRKLAKAQQELDAKYGEIICNAAIGVFGQSRFDSDESWQASEALLKR